MSSIKNMRTTSDIERVLQTALTQRIDNPLLSGGAVQITSVETSADLSTCKVFVDIRHENPDAIMFQLFQSSSYFRNQIAQNVRLRRTPNITFIQDAGRQNAERVEELLKQIKS